MNNQIKLLLIVLIIAFISVLTIYSGTYDKDSHFERNIYKRQILWIALGLVFFLFFSFFPYRKLRDWVFILYGLVIFLLVLVMLLGSVRMGAQRWIKIVWLNVQPSELAKLVLVIFLARYFSKSSLRTVGVNMKNMGIMQSLIIPFLYVCVPMLLIMKQPDLGSSLMLLFIFLFMVYFARVNFRYILGFIAFLAACSPFLWHALKDYQKDRLLVFLNPNTDPLGAGYTIIQSRIAVGSGGFFGRGWLSGSQGQLHFLPESHTDFIFSSFAEEWGFAGSLVLFLLYALLIKTCLDIALKENDQFGRIMAAGISSMLAVQIFINLAMTIGLAPVVGIPLPLMSYGGSSLFITFISLGILANIDRTRAVF